MFLWLSALIVIAFLLNVIFFKLSFLVTKKIADAKEKHPESPIAIPSWGNAAAIVIVLAIYLAFCRELLKWGRSLLVESAVIDIAFATGMIAVFLIATTIVVKGEHKLSLRHAAMTATLFVILTKATGMAAAVVLRDLVERIA